MGVSWLFHLKSEVASVSIDLGGVESGRVGVKSTVVYLEPPACVEVVKVIAPLEVESSRRRVVGVVLNIVVVDVERHLGIIKTAAPSLVGWSPEVHHDSLGSVHGLHIEGIPELADDVAIDAPKDMVWCPFDFILMPVPGWVKICNVRLVLSLPSLNCVGAEWARHGRNEFDVNLVPITLGEIRLVVESEERCDGTRLVAALHLHLEQTI